MSLKVLPKKEEPLQPQVAIEDVRVVSPPTHPPSSSTQFSSARFAWPRSLAELLGLFVIVGGGLLGRRR
jgi:hypothetical protein